MISCKLITIKYQEFPRLTSHTPIDKELNHRLTASKFELAFLWIVCIIRGETFFGVHEKHSHKTQGFEQEWKKCGEPRPERNAKENCKFMNVDVTQKIRDLYKFIQLKSTFKISEINYPLFHFFSMISNLKTLIWLLFQKFTCARFK